jgi:hypothetical protein
MPIPLLANISFIFTGDGAKLRADYDALLASVAQMNEFMGKMIMMLQKRGSLTDDEITILIQHYTQLAAPNLNAALAQARKKNNPLTPDEANRLQYYINKANEGQSFLYDEIDDYSQLVEKAKQELSKESNPWPLIALGAFLIGLAIGSGQKKK